MQVIFYLHTTPISSGSYSCVMRFLCEFLPSSTKNRLKTSAESSIHPTQPRECTQVRIYLLECHLGGTLWGHWAEIRFILSAIKRSQHGILFKEYLKKNVWTTTVCLAASCPNAAWGPGHRALVTYLWPLSTYGSTDAEPPRMRWVTDQPPITGNRA